MLTAITRTVILYLVVVLALRLTGKRQVGELQPTELVVAILISELAAVPMQNFGIPLLSGVIPIVTLLCLETILSFVSSKSIRFRNVFSGTTSVLIKNGRIDQQELSRLRISADELLEELRLKNVFDITTVGSAFLETNGQLSVLLKPEFRQVGVAQMNLPTDTLPTEYHTLIVQGRLLSQNLNKCGRDRRWLDAELKAAGLPSVSEVYLMVVDNRGQVLVVPQESPNGDPAKKEG